VSCEAKPPLDPLSITGRRAQKYLQDMVRVLAVATEMTGDEKRAAFVLGNEPLSAFGHKTADALVQDGQADKVIAYLESLAGGAGG